MTGFNPAFFAVMRPHTPARLARRRPRFQPSKFHLKMQTTDPEVKGPLTQEGTRFIEWLDAMLRTEAGKRAMNEGFGYRSYVRVLIDD